MAIAIESGSATIATVRPAIRSDWKFAKLYPSRNTVTSFGAKSSAKLGWARGEGRVCVDISLC
jgi:hypothetical protein